MANGNPFTTIDLPPEWPVGSGDVTQTNGVLTAAGKEWVNNILQQPMYKGKLDPFENPTVVTNGTQVTFKNVAETTDEAKGGEGIWFSGEGALANVFDDALKAGYPFYEIDVVSRAGELSWQTKASKRAADQTWTVYEADDGSVFMYDKEVGPSSRVSIAQASTITPTGPNVEQIGTGIKNADGSVTKFYSVTDSQGRTSMQSVKEWDTITKDSAIPLETGGTLIPTGGGRYAYEPPPEAPFTTSPDDVVQVAGGQLVKTSKNQYQFVRDTYDPGVKTDPGTGRQFVQSASGTWTELDPRYQQGVVESGGREFLQQTTGALAELAPRFAPEVTEVDGMSLLQQRSGAISQLAKPNLDQIITQALVDGEYDKAFAFQDFRDRPSAAETFQTALEFARSPADQILISSIARGEQTVQPPPPGTIQRVGPQADFLVQAYQDFQRRTQAGRAPTEEEATTLSARAAAGASPLTDTLQARLETMTRDMERKDEEHAVKMQGLIQKQSEEAQLFQTKLNIAKGLNADGSVKTTVSTAPVTGESGTPSASTGASSGAGSTAAAQNTAARQALRDFQSGEYDGNWETWAEAQGFFRNAGAGMSSPLSRGDAAGIAAGMMRNRGITDPATIMAEIERFANSNLATMQASQAAMQAVDETPDETPSLPAAAASVAPIIAPTAPSLPAQATVEEASYQPVTGASLAADVAAGRMELGEATTIASSLGTALPAAPSGDTKPADISFAQQRENYAPTEEATTASPLIPTGGFRNRAGGGIVQPGEITVVGEQGPEIAMMPPGTHILPLGRATKQDIKAAQATGRAYQQGGIVFGELPFGIRQLQAGRPITPSRGYLSQAAGLTLPSAQALSNLTPESRDVYFDLARQAGIPSRAFGQELQTAMPSGRRLPTSRMLPFSSRGVR
jgi:hypothetical protein